MRISSAIGVFAALATLASAEGVIVPGKSGIPAIDTLPTYEWDIPTKNNSLMTTMLLGLAIPGGAQFYTEHYVRGGFLFAIETGLAYEVFLNKPNQQEKRIRDSRKARDSVEYYTGLMIQTGTLRPEWVSARKRNLAEIRTNNDIKMKEEDLRRSELAWMCGLHLYGLMDGYGIWKHNQGRSTEQRSVIGAVWRGALVPGWGQFYNDEYGKAGMLYMSFIGGIVSLNSRQGMVEYFLERRRTASSEGASADEISQLDEDILFFRKKRNQYIWGMALFYLYSIADAAVDAALSDFDSPLFWALIPDPNKNGLGIEAGIRF